MTDMRSLWLSCLFALAYSVFAIVGNAAAVWWLEQPPEVMVRVLIPVTMITGKP